MIMTHVGLLFSQGFDHFHVLLFPLRGGSLPFRKVADSWRGHDAGVRSVCVENNVSRE